MNQTLAQLWMASKTFWPNRRKPDPKHAIPEEDKNLAGKTVVFTGGTDGMGRVAVEMLYQMGVDIVLVGRSQSKVRRVMQELKSLDKNGAHCSALYFEQCDLSLMRSVHNCAQRILKKHPKIDILVNCAGANFRNEFSQTKVLKKFGPSTSLLLSCSPAF